MSSEKNVVIQTTDVTKIYQMGGTVVRALDGVSLTVTSVSPGSFSVALIPYTLDHTNLGTLEPGDKVNLEFDILGKYVQKNLAHFKSL